MEHVIIRSMIINNKFNTKNYDMNKNQQFFTLSNSWCKILRIVSYAALEKRLYKNNFVFLYETLFFSRIVYTQRLSRSTYTYWQVTLLTSA